MRALEPRKTESRRVLRAQLGDRTALERLLEGTQPWLFQCLLRLLPRREAAEDVLQDVFITICRKLKWLHDPRLYRAWVYRIATRQAFRQLRRDRSRAERFTSEELDAVLATTPARETLSEEEAAALERRLSELPGGPRTVVVLHYLEGLTLREVADVLDVPLGTVKSRLAYGLRRLRGRLSGGAAPA
jgi:RNA polymerase sigma-70 factor (ECF subfamily)